MKLLILALALALLIGFASGAEQTFSIKQINGTELEIAYARAYGVIPDDGLNDSAALQAALNSGIRIVQLPEGEIDIVNTTITVPGDTDVRGTGRATTILNLSGTNAYLSVTANRTILRDFMLYSKDYSARAGVKIEEWQHNWRLENLWIKGIAAEGTWGTYQGYGIWIDDSCWIGQVENCLVDTCFAGIRMDNAANDIQIISSQFNNCTQDGAYLPSANTHGLSFSGCDFEGNSRYGANFINVQQATMWGCYFEDNAYSGIYLDGSSDSVTSGIISIYGSTFYANGYANSVPSIEAYRVNRTLVSGCRFAGNHSDKGAIRVSEAPLEGKTDQKTTTLIENRYDELEGAGAGIYVTNPQYAVIIDSRRQGGSTAHRPSAPSKYETYFDSTLGKPIVYSGSAWLYMDGTSV